jgi:hypothetical protein
MAGEGFPIFVDLVDRGLIQMLDVMFVRRGMDDSMRGRVAGYRSRRSVRSPGERCPL